MANPIVPAGAVTSAVTPPPEQDHFRIARLAQEIAMDVKPIADILKLFNLTQAQYDDLCNNHFFASVLEAAKIEWQGARKTSERTQIEAAALFEQAMPYIYGRMIDGSEPLNHVVEAAKLMARAGGIGETARGGGPSERFTITINLGADKIEKFEQIKQPFEPIIQLSAERPNAAETPPTA